MGLTVAQYDDTPALTVDWDLELLAVEKRVEKALTPKPGQPPS